MAEQIFKKKTEWTDEINNYVGESEITVTITLCEYRELIRDNALSYRKITELTNKIDDLKDKVAELENKLKEE